MARHILLFVTLFGAFCQAAQAQQQLKRDSTIVPDNNPTDNDTETQVIIENALGDDDTEEFDFDTQFEYLEGYVKDPLDLNRAGERDFTAMGLLSSLQIQSLISYRLRYGQIYSIYELQGVPMFDLPTIRKIAPYVTLAATKAQDKLDLKRFFKYGQHQLFLRYIQVAEKADGYLREDSLGGFRGSPDRWYFRYRFTYKDRVSVGLTLEKDAGEQFFTPFSGDSKAKFFDFFSAHFYLKDVSKHCSAIALGDYQVFFGQGLTVWGGFRARKGVDVMNLKRISPSLRPYSSVNEALFMRGAAASFDFGRVETTIFASHRFRDANIAEVDTLFGDDGDPDFSTVEVSSLQLMGTHRTDSEIADKNSLQQINAGANVRYIGDNWAIGANGVFNHFNKTLSVGNDLYEQYYFSGKSLFNGSLDYAYNYKTLQLFGETAVSSNGGVATLNGMLASLDPRLQFSLFQRYYSRNYRTFTGNALGEGSQVNNEWGIYMGVRSQLTNKLTMNAYVDFFAFPWLRYQVDAPSRGYEYLVKLDYSFSRTMSMYAQFRFEEKGGNLSGNPGIIDYLVANRRQSLRLHFNCKLSDYVELRSRAEFSWYRDADKTKGFLIFQDVIVNAVKVPFKAQMRLAFFDTDDYDTRIYAYENDMLYSFSVPALYGKGLRYYLNLNYKINKYINVWLRFSQTYYTDREVISSGLNEIQGRMRTEIKAQVQAKF